MVAKGLRRIASALARGRCSSRRACEADTSSSIGSTSNRERGITCGALADAEGGWDCGYLRLQVGGLDFQRCHLVVLVSGQEMLGVLLVL